MNYNSINKFQVSFRQHEYDPEIKSFWVGTKIYFSGNNATQFYKIIQQQKFDWDIFGLQRTSLSRFDLNYLRELKTNEQSQDIEIFMEKCCHRIKTETKIGGGINMQIGSRKSPNFYRVYQKNYGLEFELELKYDVLIPFQQFLFSNRIYEFEHALSKHFYERSFDCLRFPFRISTLHSKNF